MVSSMEMTRAGGILLHPTSLPGTPLIGTLGPPARRWLEWLDASGCRLWQILPLVPVGSGNSPYDGFSAFAGNTLLISLELLVAQGLLKETDLPASDPTAADYELASTAKAPLLTRAAGNFLARGDQEQRRAYENFCRRAQFWLDDFALYMTLHRIYKGASWTQWPEPLKWRDAETLKDFRQTHHREIEIEKVLQFFFFDQWREIKMHAAERGIGIIGDMPIFVSHSSADVWAWPQGYKLRADGEPKVVAGVPPDYFSATGQRWGNPVYHWLTHADNWFEWWVERVRWSLQLVDYLRLDHFRGFVQAWEIPAEAATAQGGRWVTGPGFEIFQALEDSLGELPLIAEDLGVITEDVIELREELRLPGMKVLQFGLESGPDHEFLPHKYPKDCVAYTGTHDNNTSRGWYESQPSSVKRFVKDYLPSNGPIAWRMIEAIWASEAKWAIAPLQDFLDLGTKARMNIPGTSQGNWQWRASERHLNDELALKVSSTLNRPHHR
ncbi:MAG: 4-alpha-glucanotransferase [Anaerolineales bacterium]